MVEFMTNITGHFFIYFIPFSIIIDTLLIISHHLWLFFTHILRTFCWFGNHSTYSSNNASQLFWNNNKYIFWLDLLSQKLRVCIMHSLQQFRSWSLSCQVLYRWIFAEFIIKNTLTHHEIPSIIKACWYRSLLIIRRQDQLVILPWKSMK